MSADTWTCIDDKMPPEDFNVLVVNDNYPEQMYVAQRRDDYYNSFVIDNLDRERQVYPTHWMYLPLSPKYLKLKNRRVMLRSLYSVMENRI